MSNRAMLCMGNPMKYLAVIIPLLLAADWPRYLGPNRDGHSAEKNLNWNWAKAPPNW